MLTKILEWIKSLRNPQPVFGGLPVCPYSSRATIAIVSCEHFEDAARLISWMSLPKYCITIIVILDGNVSGIDKLNEDLQEKDLVVFASDASKPMIIDGFRTTHHIGTFVIVQGKSELELARQQLSKTNYYERWTLECLTRVGKK